MVSKESCSFVSMMDSSKWSEKRGPLSLVSVRDSVKWSVKRGECEKFNQAV